MKIDISATFDYTTQVLCLDSNSFRQIPDIGIVRTTYQKAM